MASTTTYLQLLIDTGDELGDCIKLVATADGLTTTFVSTSDMLYADDGLNGREVWYADAVNTTNEGTRRLVTATVESTGTITVSPAWPAISKSTDTIYLFNANATGVTIPEIRRKINQLIRRVRSELAVAVADTAAEFALTDPVIDIPTAWDYLLGLQIERDPNLTNVWSEFPGEPYTVNLWDSPKTVVIKEQFRGVCHGKRLRLIGENDLSELSADTDTTTVPAAWLAKTAAAELLGMAAAQGRTTDPAMAITKAELLKSEAGQLSSYIGKRHRLGRRIDLRQ